MVFLRNFASGNDVQAYEGYIRAAEHRMWPLLRNALNHFLRKLA